MDFSVLSANASVQLYSEPHLPADALLAILATMILIIIAGQTAWIKERSGRVSGQLWRKTDLIC